MAIRFLSPWQNYRVGQVVTLPATVEAGLVSSQLAEREPDAAPAVVAAVELPAGAVETAMVEAPEVAMRPPAKARKAKRG